MDRIAYLASKLNLPDSNRRRPDAYRHEEDFRALANACGDKELALVPMDWDQPIETFSEFSTALVRSTWDYVDRPVQFLETIEDLSRAGILVFNTPDLIRWNISKTYLKSLSASGIPIVPTIWKDSPSADDLDRAFDTFQSDRIVLKRQIGASAEGQRLFWLREPVQAGPLLDCPGMLQPFMVNTVIEGEYSFLFVDGEFSHLVLKRAREGDYRVQRRYGGSENALAPTRLDLDKARSVLDCLPGGPPLVARIDMVRDHEGMLVVMEAELIDPYLFPFYAPNLGELFASALKRRV